MATGSEAPESVGKNSAKKPGFMSVLVPVAAILALILVGLAYLHDRRAASPGVNSQSALPTQRKVGEAIPDFDLKSLDGKTTKLSEIKAKVILINFWATWCPPCVREMPSLQKLADTYGDKGLAVIGVNLDEDPEKVLEPFRKKHEIRFPTYIDPTGESGDRLQVSGLPLTLVVDGNRKLLYEQVGDEDWFNDDFRKQFEIWLNGDNK